jgi:hypothetical protein
MGCDVAAGVLPTILDLYMECDVAAAVLPTILELNMGCDVAAAVLPTILELYTGCDVAAAVLPTCKISVQILTKQDECKNVLLHVKMFKISRQTSAYCH